MESARMELPRPLLRQLERSDGDVRIQSLRLDAIERDENQPREHFGPEELQELADSMATLGLLQEPVVYPVANDDAGRATRWRLLFGERRCRAAKLAGWSEIRCKVIPKNAPDDLVARLKQIDQQGAENTARAALSAVEEARSIRAKMDVLRKMQPGVTDFALYQQVAAERKCDETMISRLIGLLSAPASLRTAILKKEITSREIAFQLASHWSALLKKHQGEAQAKREVLFHTKLKDWAKALGLDPDAADTLKRFAAEQFLEPKVVKAYVRTAEKIEAGATEAFDRVVMAAIKEQWTVKDARRLLKGRGQEGKGPVVEKVLGLFERSDTKGKARFTVHLERLRDPELATPAAKSDLAAALRQLLVEIEGTPAREAQG